MTSPPHATPLPRVLLLLLPLFLAQIGLYYHAFGVKPASDDFPIVHEIVRGNALGPGVFFRESMSNMHHRPFKSLSIWAFGQLSDEHRAAWIRVLHFIAMAGYTTVLGLWISRLGLSPLAVLVGGAVMLFHPALPPALASVDGMDGLMASTFVWLGAWCVFVFRERIFLQLAATTVCFILAAGWKEYSFAIVPLAAWTALCFGGKRRWRNAGVLLAGLCAVFVVILFIRQRAIPPGYGAGTKYASLNPIQWAQNAAVIISGLLFFGNSIWVYVHQSPAVLAVVAICILLAFFVIGVGLVERLRSPERNTRRWLLFLLGSFIAASFPVNLIIHVSEMYMAPLLLPLAILCAISLEGWRRKTRPARLAAAGLACIALCTSVRAVRAKVEGLRDVGQRAENQMMQVLSMLPPDAHDMRVAILFDLNELPPRRTFGVYRMGDEVLVVHSMALDYFAPGRKLMLGAFPLGSADFKPEQFDAIFEWNYEQQRFERWTQ